MNRKSSESPRIVRELTSTAALLRSVPLSVTVLFIAAVLAMNFLARITLLSLPFLALNAGITVSWLSFLLMDVMTRHYGPRAATQLSVVAILVNLCCCFFCVVLSRVKGLPGLDMVVGGQWSILTASTIAFVISALTNNYTNCYIGRFFRKNPDGKAAFAARSFVSTFLSQVVDNFPFRVPGFGGHALYSRCPAGPLDRLAVHRLLGLLCHPRAPVRGRGRPHRLLYPEAVEGGGRRPGIPGAVLPEWCIVMPVRCNEGGV